MQEYNKTAIVLDNTKEAAIYFDYIIPINLGIGLIKNKDDFDALFSGFVYALIPPSLRDVPHFSESLNAVYMAMWQLLLQRQMLRFRPTLANSEHSVIDPSVAILFSKFLDEFKLKELPVDCTHLAISHENMDCADVAVTISSLELIDAESASWEQIMEFRRDSEAREKLRRFRLFAYENYSGKPKNYIEDDILKRMEDCQEAIRRWGFETKHCALHMLLTSKMIAGALTGSLVSTLFGAHATAIAAAAGGAGLEIGRIALELSKQRFALRSMLADNPISYISYARSKLHEEA